MLKWHRVSNIIVCDDPDQVEGLLMKWMGLPELMGCKPGPEDQWQPWMTDAQKREVQTGRTSLDDALDDWGV